MIKVLLLVIISILFPPALIITVPLILMLMVKSGTGRMGNGIRMMKESIEEIKQTRAETKKEWANYKNSKVHAKNRTEEDEQNLARLRAELARDRELKKNRK